MQNANTDQHPTPQRWNEHELAVFETEEELICESPCQAEGDLFAHEDPAELVSTYTLVLEEDLSVNVELCTQVVVDIQKSILNINSNEAVWVTIFGSDNSVSSREM